MLKIRACGWGEDSSRANTMPSTRKSSVNFASPVTLAITSCGMKSCPRCLSAMVDLLQVAGRAHHRVQVIVVRAAAAEVAGHGLARLFPRRRGIFLQQRHGRDHLPRRAESALRAQFVDEGLLHWMQ